MCDRCWRSCDRCGARRRLLCRRLRRRYLGDCARRKSSVTPCWPQRSLDTFVDFGTQHLRSPSSVTSSGTVTVTPSQSSVTPCWPLASCVSRGLPLNNSSVGNYIPVAPEGGHPRTLRTHSSMAAIAMAMWSYLPRALGPQVLMLGSCVHGIGDDLAMLRVLAGWWYRTGQLARATRELMPDRARLTNVCASCRLVLAWGPRGHRHAARACDGGRVGLCCGSRAAGWSWVAPVTTKAPTCVTPTRTPPRGLVVWSVSEPPGSPHTGYESAPISVIRRHRPLALGPS